jgi:dipeptidyl aminopeptidase/acylaminoacyl peptidase
MSSSMSSLRSYLARSCVVAMGFLSLTAVSACSSTGAADVSVALERTVTEITLPARDGRSLKAVLSMPSGPGPFPVLVTVHGGQGDRSFEVLRNVADPDSDSPTVRMLNRNHWIIMAPGYRNDWFGAEETDLVDAIRYAAALPKADPRRVGVLGGSNGGRLTLRAAIIDPDLMRCIGAGSPFLTHPPAFFGDKSAPPWSLISPAAETWMGATRDRLQNAVRMAAVRAGSSLEALLADHSSQLHADRIKASVLLLTSDADEQVPAVMVQGLVDALNRAGNPAIQVHVEKSLHGFYWSREGEFGAREGRGARTDVQLQEEERSRIATEAFFRRCFAAGAE